MRIMPLGTDRTSVGQRLIAIRSAKGMTARDVIERVGIKQPQYSQWEGGKRLPKIEDALIYCERMNVTLDYLYRGVMAGLDFELAEQIRALRGKPLKVMRVQSAD